MSTLKMFYAEVQLDGSAQADALFAQIGQALATVLGPAPVALPPAPASPAVSQAAAEEVAFEVAPQQLVRALASKPVRKRPARPTPGELFGDRERVAVWLREHGSPARVKDVAAGCGIPAQRIQAVLASPMFTRPQRGHVWLAAELQEPSPAAASSADEPEDAELLPPSTAPLRRAVSSADAARASESPVVCNNSAPSAAGASDTARVWNDQKPATQPGVVSKIGIARAVDQIAAELAIDAPLTVKRLMKRTRMQEAVVRAALNDERFEEYGGGYQLVEAE